MINSYFYRERFADGGCFLLSDKALGKQNHQDRYHCKKSYRKTPAVLETDLVTIIIIIIIIIIINNNMLTTASIFGQVHCMS